MTTNSAADGVKLANGDVMPITGFGTGEIKGESAPSIIAEAIEVGYRHLDTATLYENEREVGKGMKIAALPR